MDRAWCGLLVVGIEQLMYIKVFGAHVQKYWYLLMVALGGLVLFPWWGYLVNYIRDRSSQSHSIRYFTCVPVTMSLLGWLRDCEVIAHGLILDPTDEIVVSRWQGKFGHSASYHTSQPAVEISATTNECRLAERPRVDISQAQMQIAALSRAEFTSHVKQ
jgi:hypothetical protein